MAPIKVAINGFGRIGRILFRFLEEQPGVGEQNNARFANLCAALGCKRLVVQLSAETRCSCCIAYNLSAISCPDNKHLCVLATRGAFAA
jgi:homoserine dehydrogenase